MVIAMVWKGRGGQEKEDGGLKVSRLSPEKLFVW